jgi:hypothetical protein
LAWRCCSRPATSRQPTRRCQRQCPPSPCAPTLTPAPTRPPTAALGDCERLFTEPPDQINLDVALDTSRNLEALITSSDGQAEPTGAGSTISWTCSAVQWWWIP